MSRKSVLVLAAGSTFATVLWFTGNVMALPGAPLASSGVPQIVGAAAPNEGSGVILVQNRARAGGQRGGRRRSAGGRRR